MAISLFETTRISGLSPTRGRTAEVPPEWTVVVNRVGLVGGVRFDEVHEHARPLDMPQEFVTEAESGVGAFDEARMSASTKPSSPPTCTFPKIRVLCGERVIGDFGMRARHAAEQR